MIIQKPLKDVEYIFGHRLGLLVPPGEGDGFTIDVESDFQHRIIGMGIQEEVPVAFERTDPEGEWKSSHKVSLDFFQRLLEKFCSYPYMEIERVDNYHIIGGSCYYVVLRIDGVIYRWVLGNPAECGSPYVEIGEFLEGILKKKYKSWFRKFP